MYGTGTAGSVKGPGYTYYLLAGVPSGPFNGFFLYPMDNYFNLLGSGPNPLVGAVGLTANNMVVSNCCLGYMAPFNGEVVRISVNSAMSTSNFDQAIIDVLFVRPSGVINFCIAGWSSFIQANGTVQSGYVDIFGGPTSFSSGDLICCYVGDQAIWSAPQFAAEDGEFNVTVYVKYTL